MSIVCPIPVRVTMCAVLVAGTLSGCLFPRTHCYVTLNPGGLPTAEACETGPHLVVRPITETNAAFYVPPYVIGALQYEGFLTNAAAETRLASEANGTVDHTTAYRSSRTNETPLHDLGDARGQAPAETTALKRSRLGPAVRVQSEKKRDVPGGARRLKPEPRIDNEVLYEKPLSMGLTSFPISNDLLL